MDVYSRYPQPHERDEKVTVFWPDGPHNYVILFHRVTPAMANGWMYIRGFVVEPNEPEHRATREFYVRPVDGGYALLPKQR